MSHFVGAVKNYMKILKINFTIIRISIFIVIWKEKIDYIVQDLFFTNFVFLWCDFMCLVLCTCLNHYFLLVLRFFFILCLLCLVSFRTIYTANHHQALEGLSSIRISTTLRTRVPRTSRALTCLPWRKVKAIKFFPFY